MRKLNIGGEKRKEGWEIFNIKSFPCVDYIGSADNMSRFNDDTFDEIYASHILEHLGTGGGYRALREWHRILKSGGKIYISVPDLDVICSILLDKSYPEGHLIYLIAMLYGGQRDEFDVHYYGYNLQLLNMNLSSVGFSKGKRVESFGIFDDMSSLEYLGRKISLNIIATKR